MYHHERYYGKGYPNRVSGKNISLEARTMPLAYVSDALLSKRCLKGAAA
ncbi:MAG: two-component system response regulator, partial [Oscillospiraceae bacterium]|nr:two-component system response regulator [Oscillospiraceae bacterium]